MVYYLGLSLLSNKHDSPHKAERRELLSAEARRILSQLEGRSLAQDDIATDAAGRPFFPNRDTDFSISHSGNLAAVSLACGENLRIGCDVELVRPRAGAPAIAEEFFTAPEREYVESGGRFDETRFYQIWTLKECFLKLRGFSVFDMAGAPSFIITPCNSVVNILFEQNSFYLYELSGSAGERYILATAIAGMEQTEPEIRWFSQETLDCRCIAKIGKIRD
jgi:phosphopantetheinyl transferase (holo-ACP synthase)